MQETSNLCGNPDIFNAMREEGMCFEIEIEFTFKKSWFETESVECFIDNVMH